MFDKIEYVIYGERGTTRHVKTERDGRRGGTLCNMFYDRTKIRPAREDEADVKVCGACLRTYRARTIEPESE